MALLFSDFSVKGREFYVSDLYLGQGDETPAHDHDFYEVMVVLQGGFQEKMSHQVHPLPKGTTRFVKPEDKHCFSGENSLNWLRNIAISREFFQQFQEESALENREDLFTPFTLDPSTLEQFQNKTKRLLQPNHSEEAYVFLVKSILSDLFVAGLIEGNNHNHVPEWLKSLYTAMYLEENYLLGLPRLPQVSNKSQEHINRAFRKYYNITPTEHINHIRLEKAAEDLRNSEEKIIDIIYGCGFQNVSYFNRLFKNQFGLRPRDYRDHHKKFL